MRLFENLDFSRLSVIASWAKQSRDFNECLLDCGACPERSEGSRTPRNDIGQLVSEQRFAGLTDFAGLNTLAAY